LPQVLATRIACTPDVDAEKALAPFLAEARMRLSLRSLSKTLSKRHPARELLQRPRKWAKATRGFLGELLEQRVLSAESARPLALRNGSAEESATLTDHVATVVDKRLAKLIVSADFSATEDPVEAVHDLRVASRRLRAFLTVFEPFLDDDIMRRAEKPVKRITRAAGKLRDWDVQRGILENRLESAAADSERAAIEHVLERVDAQRARERRRAKRKLRGIDLDGVHRTVCAALGEAIAHLPAPGQNTVEFAWATLSSLIESAARHQATVTDQNRAHVMHELRVDLKRLRYALELFEPVLRPRYRELHRKIAALQELLGSHHDLVVLEDLVLEHREDLELMHRDTLRRGLTLLEERTLTERLRIENEFGSTGFDGDAWLASIRTALTEREATVARPPESASVVVSS
jgi:CHAD domain-containing protein